MVVANTKKMGRRCETCERKNQKDCYQPTAGAAYCLNWEGVAEYVDARALGALFVALKEKEDIARVARAALTGISYALDSLTGDELVAKVKALVDDWFLWNNARDRMASAESALMRASGDDRNGEPV